MPVSLTSLFFRNARGLTLTDGGGITWSINKNTNAITATTGSGGGLSGANPTAKVGLTTVNGSAITYLRSDAAPPLDLTISPTWTGNHTFAPASGNALTLGAAGGIAAVAAAPGVTSLQVNTPAAAAGVPISFTVGASSTGAGGNIVFTAGNAGGNSVGGGFTQSAGTGAGTGGGGGFNLTAGAGGLTGVGGGISLTSGAGANGTYFSGSISIAGGAASAAGVAGDLLMYAASGVDAAHSGNVTIQNFASNNSFQVDPFGNVIAQCVTTPAVADTQGFFYIPAIAGAPTGVPAKTATTFAPMRFDKTNNKLWVYNGAWKGVVVV